MLFMKTICICYEDRRKHRYVVWENEVNISVAVDDAHGLEKDWLLIEVCILAGCCCLRRSSLCRYCECIPWVLWTWRTRLYLRGC